MNMEQIDNYVNSLHMRSSLLFAKKQYIIARKELIENGHYIDRPRCKYTLNDLDYAIKLINLKLRFIKD